MSDASEVKRWLTTLPRAGTGVEAWQDDNCGFIEVVSSVDHDRIVAELKAGTANALKRVFNRQIGFLVSANAFRVLCEEIEKYDPFFKMPNSSERRRFVADRNAEMQNLKETTARQARVIEKLKRYTQHRVECIYRTGVFQYSNDCDCGLKAIEQGEGM